MIEDFKVVNRQVLSELLWYETKTEFDIAISAVSTSLNNLLCVKQGITLDAQFSKEYRNLITYFSCVKIIEHIQGISGKVIGIGLYDQMMEAIILNASKEKLEYEGDVRNSDVGKIAVFGNNSDAVTRAEMINYACLIFINKPQNTTGLKRIVIREVPKKKYSFLNMEMHDIYISEKINLELPIKVSMKVTGMDLVISEGEQTL